MKKILVVGSNGMAGHVIKLYLEKLNIYDVWGIARGIKSNNKLICLDITNTSELENIIKYKSFDVIINCIGILNQTAENNPEMAIWINSYFPHFLSKLGKKHQFKLIHISTDCVFSGLEGAYNEESFKNGIGYYAKSKGLGEVINSYDLTFRTSIIGPELNKNGVGLFNWFMSQKNEINGFTHVYWSGITTLELAKSMNEAIKQDITGLYQLVNNTKISKYNLICEFNRIFRNNKLYINQNSDYKSDKSLINSRTDFDYKIPNYKTMIEDMRDWMIINKDLYLHY